MPDVDVVIPCYRYGHMLPDAVRSVLGQPEVTVRVLIIDDASDDGSARVAAALAADDDRVEVRVHERNLGCYATYDEGVLDWASAAYTLLLSADDILAPGALARATALLDAHPEVGFVYGHAPDWEGRWPLPVEATGGPRSIVYPGRAWLRRRFAAGSNVVPTPAVVTRTAVQQRVGGYDAALPHTADFDLWMRFALHADVGFVAGVDQAYCRQHGANMSDAFDDGQAADLEHRLLAYSAVLRRANGQLPDAAALDRRMRRALATEALLRAGHAYEVTWTPLEGSPLVAFAEQTRGDLARQPLWHTLRLRQRIAPRLAPSVRPSVLAAAGPRLRARLRRGRMLRRGV